MYDEIVKAVVKGVNLTGSAISQGMINSKAEDNVEKALIANLSISNQNLHREQSSAAVKGNAAAVTLPVNAARQEEHSALREVGMQLHQLKASEQAGYLNAALGIGIEVAEGYGQYEFEQAELDKTARDKKFQEDITAMQKQDVSSKASKVSVLEGLASS